MTGNRSPLICTGNASSLTQQGDEPRIQILPAQRFATMSKEVLHLGSGFPIIACWLTRRPHLFPFVDALSHDGIDRFLKGSPGLVGGHREEAGALFRKKLSCFRDGDIFPLPANAPESKTDNLI